MFKNYLGNSRTNLGCSEPDYCENLEISSTALQRNSDQPTAEKELKSSPEPTGQA